MVSPFQLQVKGPSMLLTPTCRRGRRLQACVHILSQWPAAATLGGQCSLDMVHAACGMHREMTVRALAGCQSSDIAVSRDAEWRWENASCRL